MSPVDCVIPNHLSKKYNEGTLKKLTMKQCYPEYLSGAHSNVHRFNTTAVPQHLQHCFQFKPRKLGCKNGLWVWWIEWSSPG